MKSLNNGVDDSGQNATKHLIDYLNNDQMFPQLKKVEDD